MSCSSRNCGVRLDVIHDVKIVRKNGVLIKLHNFPLQGNRDGLIPFYKKYTITITKKSDFYNLQRPTNMGLSFFLNSPMPPNFS